MFCLGIGALGIPVNFILKQFPVSEDDNECDLQSEAEIEGAARVVDMAKSTCEGQSEIKMIKVQRISGISENRPINAAGGSNDSAAFNMF